MEYMYVILTVILLLMIYELLHERKLRVYGKQLPGPVAYPFIGCALTFLGSSVDFFKTSESLTKKYGYRRTVILGHYLIFRLSDPKDIEAIASNTKLINKSSEYDFMKPWLGGGLVMCAGEEWKRRRKFITPAFHLNILKQFIPVIEENVDKLVQKLSEFAGGEPVDILPAVTLCALDVISEAAMGVSINAQTNGESKYVQAVQGMCELIGMRMRHVLLRIDILFNLSPSKLKQNKYVKTLTEFTDDVIRKKKIEVSNRIESYDEETETGVKKRIAFLDLLLMPDINGEKLSDKSVRDEVNTFMFAGHDTAASAIGFALHCIAEHSDVQNKILAEQTSVFGEDMDRPIEYNDLQEMNYLDLVIKEVLRLYPSVPAIGRRVKEDCVINGLKVPKGATILPDLYHLHRRADLFDDPASFKPERFSIDRENSSKNTYGYIPFGVGSRNCIGQKFAQIEMKITISKLLRQFQFHPGGKELVLTIDIVLKSVNGINVRLTRRQN